MKLERSGVAILGKWVIRSDAGHVLYLTDEELRDLVRQACDYYYTAPGSNDGDPDYWTCGISSD